MINDYIEAQTDIKRMLEASYHNNRLTHAYIFSGENGVGKKEMALYFAAMLYSDEDNVYDTAAAKQIFKHEHPNVYEIAPDGNSIKKGQIVALQEEFSKTSLVDGPRVYIIEDADKMNVSSANSLLKFIEEPNGKEVYAILLTTDITNMLPTIISRCGHVHFKSMPKSVLYDMLIDNNVSDSDAALAKELTNNIDEALEIIASERFSIVKGLIEDFLEIKSSYDSVIYLRKNINDLSISNVLKEFLELLALVYEDMLYLEPIRFIYLKDKMNKYKEIHKDKIKGELELILDLRKKLDSNVLAKNIITNLFVNLI